MEPIFADEVLDNYIYNFFNETERIEAEKKLRRSEAIKRWLEKKKRRTGKIFKYPKKGSDRPRYKGKFIATSHIDFITIKQCMIKNRKNKDR